MRPDRMTLRQAQNAYNAIQQQITLAPYNGKAVTLPQIDMQPIFNGRKSMTWKDVTKAVCNIIEGTI